MAQQPINDRVKDAETLTRTEAIAAGLAIGWLVVVGLFFWILPPARPPGEAFDSLRFVLMLIAVFMPVAMIWVAAAAARSARIMREESFRVQTAIDAMRQTYLADQANKVAEPAVEQKLEEIAQATRKTETAVSSFASRREVSRLIVPQPAPQPTDQQALPLGTTSEDMDPPLDRLDLIRGLNFPDNENDHDGFAALSGGGFPKGNGVRPSKAWAQSATGHHSHWQQAECVKTRSSATRCTISCASSTRCWSPSRNTQPTLTC